MGLISETFLAVGCAVAGYTICYYTPTGNVENKQHDGPELSKVVERYVDLKNSGPVVGVQELGIEYIVSKKEGFKGFVFTDKESTTKGILIRSKIAGINQYSYVSLERSIANIDERIDLTGCSGEGVSKKIFDAIKKMVE
ncbi:hypothetical protein HYX11_02960 [Candidatus Woesearchaeota archaeon]|nr:hypothetical protein [Candidatus Woesearchaeota archaeon]